MKAVAPPRITLLAQDPALELSREAFFTRSGATQKGRILEAVTHVVAEKGYAGATVGEIVKVAGVSRTTFYQLFAGKKECLLASYEAATQIVLTLIGTAAVESIQDGWRSSFEAGLDAYFDTIRSEPEIARAQFVELGSIGADALIARQRAQAAHTDAIISLMALAREHDPHTPVLDSGIVRLVVAAIDERVAHALATNRPQDLDDLRESILRLVDQFTG